MGALEATRAKTEAQHPASCRVLLAQRDIKLADTREQLESLVLNQQHKRTY